MHFSASLNCLFTIRFTLSLQVCYFLRREADTQTTCNCRVRMDDIAYIHVRVVEREDLHEVEYFVVVRDIELEMRELLT